MPMVEVSAPRGALDDATRDVLMKRVTEALLKREGAPLDSPVIRASAWSYYHELPDGHFYVGAEPATSPKFRFKVTTPQGVLNEESRKGLVSDIAAIVDDVIGAAGSGANHWVLLREIRDGSWGAGGRIATLADIRAAARPRATA